MMPLDGPKTGPKWFRDWCKAAADRINMNQLVPGGNVTLNVSPGGTQITGGSSQATTAHNYTVIDASTGGTPEIQVTPGNHIDATGGGSYIPTINNNPINVKIGTPLAYPSLTVGNNDTLVWFHLIVVAIDGTGMGTAGAIQSIKIESGTSLPANTNTDVYQICAMITVTVTGGSASVQNLEGGVSASQVYQLCSQPSFWRQ